MENKKTNKKKKTKNKVNIEALKTNRKALIISAVILSLSIFSIQFENLTFQRIDDVFISVTKPEMLLS